MNCLEELNAGFAQWLRCGSPQADWLATMTRQFRQKELLVFIFGGALRDLALGREPRDLDLVCQDQMWDDVLNLVTPWITRTNRFGGLKLYVPNVGDVDLWPVRKTYAFAQGIHNLQAATRLPETVCFNIEAVVLECTEVNGCRFGAEYHFFEALHARTIDFIPLPVIADEKLTAARAGILAQKLRFHLSPRLVQWLRNTAEKHGIEPILQTGTHHYPDKTQAQIETALQLALQS